MYRRWVATLFLGFLSACSALPEWSWLSGAPSRSVDPVAGQYNFGWRLSGDRAVAPIQVFDNGRQMWLQFAPAQAVPAIFEHTAQGDRPLDYHRNGPYLVLNGVWPHLILRGGHLKSLIDRVEPTPLVEPVDKNVTPPLPERSAVDPLLIKEALAVALPATLPESVADVPVTASAAVVGVAAAEPGPTPDSVPEPTVAHVPAEQYHVSPDDKHLRAVLSRWAQTAGWTFNPEHWAVDADIPIVGSALFELGFKLAVQELVGSTELADRPLQPCFYSNRVLRIVPYAQLCDRTANLSESS
ncbi:MAG: TcpQ domain-containing protein [Paralcaligenes sp.]